MTQVATAGSEAESMGAGQGGNSDVTNFALIISSISFSCPMLLVRKPTGVNC